MPVKEFLSGILLGILGIVVILEAWSFPNVAGSAYGPGLFPALIGIVLAAGGSVLALSQLAPALRFCHDIRQQARTFPVRQLFRASMPVWIVLFYVLFAESLGAILAMGISLAVMLVERGVRARTTFLVTVISTVAIWYAFSRILSVSLPVGLLGV